MTTFSSRIATVALLIAALAAPAAAQSRRAVPRGSAPRAQAPPTRSQGPTRSDSGRQQARAPERSRGTDNQGRVRVPQSDSGRSERGSGSGAYRAAPRERAEAPPVTSVAPEARAEANGGNAAAAEEQRAQPRGGRARGDNPAVGRAVPRGSSGARGDGGYRGGPYSTRGRYYGGYRGYYGRYPYYAGYPYYYYPRHYYPYGYGAFGLGYFYYNPYGWNFSAGYGAPYYGAGYYGGGYYGGGYPAYAPAYDYDTGELRIDVEPRNAEVYVDGYYAGRVDDFDGVFQGLRLEEGGHKIEVVAPGYEPLVFDVHVQPHRKTTYRGDLIRRP
jgi:hypothetical protein